MPLQQNFMSTFLIKSALLDIHDSWLKLGTIVVTSRTAIISVISVISGSKFIHMIKVALTNIQSKIKTNDILSDPFTLMQAVI